MGRLLGLESGLRLGLESGFGKLGRGFELVLKELGLTLKYLEMLEFFNYRKE